MARIKIIFFVGLLLLLIFFVFQKNIEKSVEQHIFSRISTALISNDYFIPYWALELLSANQYESAKKHKIAPAIVVTVGKVQPMQMLWIPEGRFQMGSPESERHRESNEGPQHQVTLSQGYYMGIYEVTLAQFQQFISETGYVAEADKQGTDVKGRFGGSGKNEGFKEVKTNTWRKAPFEQTANSPVSYVSWNDATKFCKWLSQKKGKTFRLPTEAQWEYACRAGSITRFSFGYSEDLLADYGWYKDNSNNMPHAVGLKKANPWGLFDMHGNVYEWCYDVDDLYTAGEIIDPKGGVLGIHRVYRGGCWKHDSWSARSANRGNSWPDYLSHRLGFRVVREK